jgi:hypothetical protein
MKRYLLFSGDTHQALGGWLDFRGSYRDLREAELAARGAEWWQIVDCCLSEIVKQKVIAANN